MNKQRVMARLKVEEGCILHVYPDSKKIKTAGIGKNLSDITIDNLAALRALGGRFADVEDIDTVVIMILADGLTMEEAEALLSCDVDAAERDLLNNLSCYPLLDELRQEVLVNLCFNMGINRLLGFKKALAAINDGDWNRAADEMLDSRWARDVKDRRARPLAAQMRTGKEVLTGEVDV